MSHLLPFLCNSIDYDLIGYDCLDCGSYIISDWCYYCRYGGCDKVHSDPYLYPAPHAGLDDITDDLSDVGDINCDLIHVPTIINQKDNNYSINQSLQQKNKHLSQKIAKKFKNKHRKKTYHPNPMFIEKEKNVIRDGVENFKLVIVNLRQREN